MTSKCDGQPLLEAQLTRYDGENIQQQFASLVRTRRRGCQVEQAATILYLSVPGEWPRLVQRR